MPTAPTAQGGIDPSASHTPMSRTDVTLQLSARTLAWLADRPRARELVRSVWDRFAELERAGHDLGAIAALRSVVVHHQPTPAGRCPTCRRSTWRHLWRRRPFPCIAWMKITSSCDQQRGYGLVKVTMHRGTLFDDWYPPGEQIPRRLEAVFISAPGQYGDVVSMVINGFRIGDPLTDRGWNETGYRWHDALHLAHAVCLGWSPVLRNLAGLRRRSDPRTDHVEDGGRAVVADEAIA